MHNRAQSTRSLPWLFSLALAVFAFSVASLGYFPWARVVGYSAFALMAWAAATARRPLGSLFPPELLLYGLFGIWAVVSGFARVADQHLFWAGAEQVGQAFVVAGVCATVAACHRSPSGHMMAAMIVSTLVAAYGLRKGGYSGLSTQSEAERLVSVLGNSNEVGTLCLWGFTGCLYIWVRNRTRFVRTLVLCIVLVLIAALVLTGSRKSVLGFFVLVAASLWFCYKEYARKQLVAALGIVMALIATCWFASYILNATMVGRRLSSVRTTYEETGQVSVRIQLYQDGFQMLSERPLTGVGLSQFRVYSSTGQYSHSDFMEVFACTGVVGGVIYSSMLCVVCRRLWRLHRSPSAQTRFTAGLGLAFLCVFLFTGLGTPHYANTITWSVLAGFIGFGYGAEQEVRSTRRVLVARARAGAKRPGGCTGSTSGTAKMSPGSFLEPGSLVLREAASRNCK